MRSEYHESTPINTVRHNSEIRSVTILLKKEMKCSGDSEILHEIVRDNTRKSEKHELIREVS